MNDSTPLGGPVTASDARSKSSIGSVHAARKKASDTYLWLVRLREESGRWIYDVIAAPEKSETSILARVRESYSSYDLLDVQLCCLDSEEVVWSHSWRCKRTWEKLA